MTASQTPEKAALRPCPVKGCPWRGQDPEACPMHASDEAWEHQSMLRPEASFLPTKKQTRHRRS